MKLKEKERNVLSMISHDLKSPLNGILGFSRLLRETLISNNKDPECFEMISHIETAGKHMLKLVEDILAMTKAVAGKEKLQFDPVDNLEDHLKETLKVFELEANARNINLILSVNLPIPVVYWDILRLRLHVFNNIISNALKFTPSNGNININVKHFADWVYIVIEDNGPGIPPEHLKTIFNLYEQITSTNLRTSSGHGLGLSNAQLFVENHGGQVFAENIQKGGILDQNGSGARFIIELPVNPLELA